MILTQLDDVTVYRMHVPKWAVTPTSGAGAAKHGGRANRPDIEALYFNQRIEPPSWGIGDAVIARGAKGIIFKSCYPGGDTNLVLYPETFGDMDSVSVYDPDGSLRKDPLWGSW